MANRAVNLAKKTVIYKGAKYCYWELRWRGSDGKRRSETLGRIDQVSKRQAEKLRYEKGLEFENTPARRTMNRSLTLGSFLDSYLKNRQGEITPQTLVIHSTTANYLKAFFGENKCLEDIQRMDARSFKTALTDGSLKPFSQRPQDLKAATVDTHIRNVRTFFNHALADDLVLYNPFDRLSQNIPVERSWPYIGLNQVAKLLTASPTIHWRLLFSLCRLAGLRRSEALNLEFVDIDWERSMMHIIAKEVWTPKQKKSRWVPMCQDLQQLLAQAYEEAKPGQKTFIKTGEGGIVIKNISRDFEVICRRAKVEAYPKPTHNLRKSCARDWAQVFPSHVVKEWLGHSDFSVTDQHYLQVPQSEFDRLSKQRFLSEVQSNSETHLDAKMDAKKEKHEPGETREDHKDYNDNNL